MTDSGGVLFDSGSLSGWFLRLALWIRCWLIWWIIEVIWGYLVIWNWRSFRWNYFRDGIMSIDFHVLRIRVQVEFVELHLNIQDVNVQGLVYRVCPLGSPQVQLPWGAQTNDLPWLLVATASPTHQGHTPVGQANKRETSANKRASRPCRCRPNGTLFWLSHAGSDFFWRLCHGHRLDQR